MQISAEEHHTPTPASSDGPPASGCKCEAKDGHELRLFVSLLTVRVLTKCNALENHSKEVWLSHTKKLRDKTMEGIVVSKVFICPDLEAIKKISKEVVKELGETVRGRVDWEALIVSDDPAADTTFVRVLQDHISQFYGMPVKKPPKPRWKEALKHLSLITFFSVCMIGVCALCAALSLFLFPPPTLL